MKYRTNKGKDLIEMITDGFIQKDTVRYHDESYLERGDMLCPMRKDTVRRLNGDEEE